MRRGKVWRTIRISKEEKEAIIRAIKLKISILQEEIDHYNALVKANEREDELEIVRSFVSMKIKEGYISRAKKDLKRFLELKEICEKSGEELRLWKKAFSKLKEALDEYAYYLSMDCYRFTRLQKEHPEKKEVYKKLAEQRKKFLDLAENVRKKIGKEKE